MEPHPFWHSLLVWAGDWYVVEILAGCVGAVIVARSIGLLVWTVARAEAFGRRRAFQRFERELEVYQRVVDLRDRMAMTGIDTCRMDANLEICRGVLERRARELFR